MSQHGERSGHNLKPAVWLAALGVSAIVAGGMAGYKTGEVVSDAGHLFAGAAVDRWEEGIFTNPNSATLIFAMFGTLLLFMLYKTLPERNRALFQAW